LKTRKISQD